MIQSIGRTIQSAMSWPTMDLAEVARSLAGPFNDDYNQLHSCYQCHGNPLGKVYVNTPWPAVCFDVDNEVMYLKQDLRISNKAWQSQSVNDPVFDTLTHYWSMDEASGNARADSKGINDLLESGGTVDSAVGIDGNAADFQPVSQAGHCLSIAGAVTIDFKSFSFWIYVRSLPGNTVRLLSETEANGGTLQCALGGAGNIIFNDTTVGGDDPDISVNLGALNTWHLIVGATDGVLQYLSIDGGVFTTADASAGSGIMSSILAIGPTFTGSAPTVPDAKIDEVAFYSTTLTQGNVTTLWNGGAGKFYRP